MRWDDLFADLEAQAQSMAAAQRSGEVEERTRAEVGRITTVDRLRPSVGGAVRLRCAGGLLLAGELSRVGSDWLLLDERTGRESLVALTSVYTIGGLARFSSSPQQLGLVESRLGLRNLIRNIARDRSVVRIHLVDGHALDGTIDRIGADFIEMAIHPAGELRRR